MEKIKKNIKIRPFLEENNGLIYNADCLDIMKEMPNESIDLTVSSPPYDELRKYKGYNFNFKAIAKQLFRVIKNGGVVVWVVGDTVINGSETGTSFKQALYFKKIGFNLWDTMIYMKNGSQYPEKMRYYQCFEYMFVFSKGKPKTINLIKDRKNKWQGSWGKRSVRKKDGSLEQKDKVPYQEYGIRYNVWKINTGYGFSTKDKIAYEHPAIFPDKLAEDHIRSWSNEGDIVLDPMCGSGTVCKATRYLNRKFIGIEIAKEYCEIIGKRLKQRILL